MILSAMLAGCAGRDVRPERPPQPPQKPQSSAPTQEPAEPEAAPSSGGYYQDDGPHEQEPPNLSEVPDAEPKSERLHPYANRPYAVLGKSYTPDEQRQAYRQRGMASWYGKKFHGLRTSSGEVYDMYAMTAAHRTLAIPSYVRVTHVENQKSVVVRVNDRGPFHSDRIIDLSYTAAHKLGILNDGTSMVEVEAVDPELSKILSARDEKNSKQVYLQLGAFKGRQQAESYLTRAKLQLAPVKQALEIFAIDGLFKVHVGPYKDKRAANAEAAKIGKLLKLKPLMIVR
ncbi:MAG: septal ring lytic transglycosylase RlpA family protein [Burkholderiales bacterium]